MSLTEIQQAVEGLSPEERLRLTAWMVSRYPVLKVEQLMTRATTLVDNGEWTPSAPSEENRPKAKRSTMLCGLPDLPLSGERTKLWAR